MGRDEECDVIASEPSLAEVNSGQMAGRKREPVCQLHESFPNQSPSDCAGPTTLERQSSNSVRQGRRCMTKLTIAGTALQAEAPCPTQHSTAVKTPLQTSQQTNTPSPLTSAPSILLASYTISQSSLSSWSSKTSPLFSLKLSCRPAASRSALLQTPPALCDLHPAASPHPSALRTRTV